jgi:signal transduction histidine kinase
LPGRLRLGKIRNKPMTNRLINWLPPRSFRHVFTLMYFGIISAVIYFSIVSQCDNGSFLGNTTLLVAILLGLLGLEQVERYRYHYEVPLRPALAFLVVRMVLFEAVALLDCSGFAAFLYPLIPFSAYFSLGPRVSNGLALFYGVYYFWQYRPLQGGSEGGLFNLMVFTLLLGFMLMLARVIQDDERNKQHMEELLADLEATNVKLQRYAEQVAELAATEERNRLARDIHDSVGHRLTVVNIQLEKALAFKERDPAEAEQAMVDARQAAREALQDVRRSVGALRHAEQGFSLAQGLAELAQGMRNGRFTLDYQLTGSEEGYSYPALMTLYRAAQEGLTNVQKHAQATHVRLAIDLGGEVATLCLCDDGQGFETAVLDDLAAATAHSFGLQGIQERLELVQGYMDVVSRPGAGAELRITIPRRRG